MQAFFTLRWSAVLILGLGLFWIWVSRLPSAALSATPPIAAHKGFLAPDFTLESTGGETITLSQLRGKPLIVNFWASWCPPCRAEMPAMQRFYEQGGSEFILLGINASTQDSLPKVYQLIDEMQLTFPILLDTQGAAVRAYQVFSLPTTFFIDREGVIREVVIGGPLTEAGLQTRLESLLKESR